MRRFGFADVYYDTWVVYRLLFRRSVATAAVVFAAITALELGRHRFAVGGAGGAVGVVAFVVNWGAPVFVQGAVVEIVRNLHERRPPEKIRTLYAKAGRRIRSLLWAAFVYGFGVFFGLILLVVPGLIAAARWCLMAPLIMLEGETAGTAREISKLKVRGSTPGVATLLAITYVVLNGPIAALGYVLGNLTWNVAWCVWSSLTAPYYAHMLTVLYYRFFEPDRPVVAQEVFGWRSVWEGR